jgi:hypothetical protein
MLKRRQDKYYNIQGKVLDPEMSWRWEGDATGCTTKIQVVEQKLEFDFPGEFVDTEPPETKKILAMIDVDYYAHGNTSVSKFKPDSVIENWLRLVKRDVSEFING